MIAGSINHKLYAIPTTYNEAYHSIFNFLTSSNAQALGIRTVAWHSGANATGAGYWNETLKLGSNAWGCFEFMSASNPFYLLIQYSESGVAFGGVPGDPGLVYGTNNNSGYIAYAGACREGGGNPWNGTTASNGSDRKGNPVWTTGSLGLYTFPRSNSTGGSHVSSKQNMALINGGQGSFGSFDRSNPYLYGQVLHVLADENNFIIVQDLGFYGQHLVSWLGIYSGTLNNPFTTKFAGVNWAYGGIYLNLPTAAGGAAVHGSTSGNGNNALGAGAQGEGGIGIRSGTFTGSVGLVVDINQGAFFARWAMNNLISSSFGGTNAGFFTIFNPLLVAAETPYYGFLGEITFFGVAQHLPNRSTSQDMQMAHLTVGGGHYGDLYQNYQGWVIPWDGQSVPSNTVDRRGVQFLKGNLR